VTLHDYAYGIYSHYELLGYLAEQEDSRAWRRRLAGEDPTPIRFWYRQSPEPLVPRTWEIQVSKDDPQQDVPGMAYVLLDSRGILRTYEVFPPRSETAMHSWLRPSSQPADLLISWNRLVAGCWRDPLVGRDVLVGTLFGCAWAFSIHLVYALPLWLRIPRITPIHIESLPLGTTTQALGYLLAQPANAIVFSLAVTLILVFTRLLLRRKIPAVVVTCLFMATLTLGGENYFVTVPLALLNALLLTTVLVRFSILAYGTSVLILNVVVNFPVTLDFSRWYAGRSLLVLFIIVTLAIYGFRCAVGKQAPFGGLIAED